VDLVIGGAVVLGLVVVGTVLHRLGVIDLSDKSRRGGSGGGGLVGIGDEVFAPTRYEAQIERDRQTLLPAPAPVPGDGDDERVPDLASRVTIDLRDRD
jgi:hypothetical protein